MCGYKVLDFEAQVSDTKSPVHNRSFITPRGKGLVAAGRAALVRGLFHIPSARSAPELLLRIR